MGLLLALLSASPGAPILLVRRDERVLLLTSLGIFTRSRDDVVELPVDRRDLTRVRRWVPSRIPEDDSLWLWLPDAPQTASELTLRPSSTASRGTFLSVDLPTTYLTSSKTLPSSPSCTFRTLATPPGLLKPGPQRRDTVTMEPIISLGRMNGYRFFGGGAASSASDTSSLSTVSALLISPSNFRGKTSCPASVT